MVYSEFQTVNFHKGVFDLSIGNAFSGSANNPAGQLPASVDFSQPYWLSITIDPGSANEIKFSRSRILSAPYALNSERANGIPVSAVPVAGNIFPLPMVNGKIDPSLLPPTTASIKSINTVGPDNSGAMTIRGTGSVSVSNDPANHTITVSGGAGVLDTLSFGPGLQISGGGVLGLGRNLVISIPPGGISSNMIGIGAINNSHLATNSITQDKIMPTTDFTMVAVGTTAQRPATPQQGMVRFNTTTNKFEGYDGTSWVNLN